MTLKLPPTSSSGCSSKIRARELSNLLKLSEDQFFRSLAHDASPLSYDNLSYFTIDTISPITRKPEVFGQIAVVHAIADLHALGAVPTDACVSFGLDTSTLNSSAGISLLQAVQIKLKEEGVEFGKAHSYLSQEVHVTLSIVGKSEGCPPPIELERDYAIILTKELGAATACHYGWLQEKNEVISECEDLMLLSHSPILNYIQKFCMSGTTDISGFGLLGHLATFSLSEKCEIQLNVSSVPFYGKLEEIVAEYPIGCSAQRNEEDFEEFCQWEMEVSKNVKKKFFAGETSGPIACIVSENSVQDFLHCLNSNGFPKAAKVGQIRKTGIPLVRLV